MAKLPTDKQERKALPICTGVLDYFPDALAAVATASIAGNRQHLAGTPLHWDKSKSTDEADALVRHLLERGTLDTDGVRHSAKMAWRALALLQREIDAENTGHQQWCWLVRNMGPCNCGRNDAGAEGGRDAEAVGTTCTPSHMEEGEGSDR